MLDERGQFLFTVLTEGSRDYDRFEQGKNIAGWEYPACVTFPESEIVELAGRYGLISERLAWFHPRQIWYRAVRDPELVLGALTNELGSGRVFFDPRFPRRLSKSGLTKQRP